MTEYDFSSPMTKHTPGPWPDLLREAKLAIEYYDHYIKDYPGESKHFEALREAIARAEGSAEE